MEYNSFLSELLQQLPSYLADHTSPILVVLNRRYLQHEILKLRTECEAKLPRLCFEINEEVFKYISSFFLLLFRLHPLRTVTEVIIRFLWLPTLRPIKIAMDLFYREDIAQWEQFQILLCTEQFLQLYQCLPPAWLNLLINSLLLLANAIVLRWRITLEISVLRGYFWAIAFASLARLPLWDSKSDGFYQGAYLLLFRDRICAHFSTIWLLPFTLLSAPVFLFLGAFIPTLSRRMESHLLYS